MLGLSLAAIALAVQSEALRVPTSPKMCKAPYFKSALLFDCDGVLVETEELHRQAYNLAFDEFGLQIGGQPVSWSEDYYAHLANTVGGGKPKMRYHFTGLGAPVDAPTHADTACEWPSVTKRNGAVPADEAAGMALIDELQDFKTECYKRLVSTAPARPGVLEMMDAAIRMPGLAVGICSASTRGGFEKVVDAVVGKERLAALDVVIAGDDVERKKPDPEIYNTAAARLGLPSDACVVVEDSIVGLRAAKAAGMKCVVTYTEQTADQDFYALGADAALLDFGVGAELAEIFDDDVRVRDSLLESVRDQAVGEYEPCQPVF